MNLVKFDLCGPNAKRPDKAHQGDVGWDLYISRTCLIYPGQTVDVHTDVKIEMPEGIYGRITGRSSTLRHHSLLVNEGIIDNGYTGELFINIHNVGQEYFFVEPGMRLAQLIFHRIEPVEWFRSTDIWSRDGRGEEGFGSTGK